MFSRGRDVVFKANLHQAQQVTAFNQSLKRGTKGHPGWSWWENSLEEDDLMWRVSTAITHLCDFNPSLSALFIQPPLFGNISRQQNSFPSLCSPWWECGDPKNHRGEPWGCSGHSFPCEMIPIIPFYTFPAPAGKPGAEGSLCSLIHGLGDLCRAQGVLHSHTNSREELSSN